ncbi:MAG: hypothetical protein GY898_24815 [Proteobacteria bacterium]|nr:hypothetical protein [Pseudomonadota bacterium]
MTDDQRFERLFLPSLFLLSGISGLVYQVVWMRMLIRVFGITIYATSTVIAVFMGGLALGSWIAGKYVTKGNPTLRTYAKIEVGIALSALAATVAMRALPAVYASMFGGELGRTGGASATEVGLRLLLSGAVLAAPTILMGTTLPLITRWITRDDSEVGGRLALFYGLNTVGAVIGTFACGFFAIALLGEYAAVGVGVAINLTIAAVVWLHSAGARPASDAAPSTPSTGEADPARIRVFLILAGASGACALAYEVIWTRLLVLVLGNSVYAFSTMLGTYLIGIALGSLIVRRFADRIGSPALVFGALQLGVAALGVCSLQVFRAIGAQATAPRYLYSPLTEAADIKLIFLYAALVILPVTLLLGMIFPLLGRIVTTDYRQVGKSVGTLYAANTVGGVVGALATGYLLVPNAGAQGAFYLAATINLAIGVAVIAMIGGLKEPKIVAGVLAALLVMVGLGKTDKDVFYEVIERRLVLLNDMGPGRVYFHHEETAAALTGYKAPDNREILLINGIITSGKGMPGALMAHVPLLLRDAPERALVVCFGVGTTFRAAVEHVGNVDAVELVAGVVGSFPIWEPEAADFPQRDDVRIFINDGRNYMLLAEDKYDLIVVDAAPPIFSEGTVNLYSMEFLELTKARLTDDGIFMLWVPTPCFEDDFWSIARNFSETFDHVGIWSLHDIAGVLLMGSAAEIDLSVDPVVRRMAERNMAEMAPWLTRELFEEGIVMTEAELRAKAAAYPIITDNRPRTEYPLGRFVRDETFWYLPGFVPNQRKPAR